MNCNKKTIPIFTTQQISECSGCIHASGKKIWCCLFGVEIRILSKKEERRKKRPRPNPSILLEEKKILIPSERAVKKKQIQPPTISQMQRDYLQVLKGVLKEKPSTPLIDEKQYLEHRMICIACNGGYKCPHYCCGIQAQLTTPQWRCKEGRY